ncbi:hemolysin family protein [Rhodomicrobium lacus]|uniref:hemolysin family protein n=1 Tax=Rhodomicrobium lacus TaxID=2498452 RepID=UPI0013DE9E95|nr:hemolysin family protein [Rhodomicrobium lacus]
MAANLGFASNETLRETLESAIAESVAEDDKSMSQQERMMLLNVLGFGESKVSEIMLPRADVVAAEEQQTVGDLLALFAQEGHARIPVYRESLDDAIGMVHIKDAMVWVMKHGAKQGQVDLSQDVLKTTIADSKLVREVLFVPASMSALALLAKMKAKTTHLAIVVDEFGGTDGLVTLQDLVDSIVGDIADEHDDAQQFSIAIKDETFIASARAPIEDVEQVLGLSLATPGVTDDVDTLGGLILAMVGSFPKRGQLIHHPSGVTFEIVEAGPRRLHTVRIFKQRGLNGPEKPLLLPAPEGENSLGGEPASRADLRDARAA